MSDEHVPCYPTVLCVDDEPNVLRALERVLRREGWQVLTATNGPDALAMLHRHTVHVLICDEAMAGMRGVEVLRHAKVAAPKTVRILLTAHCADKNVVVPAVNEGEIFRLLAKPWDDDELCRAAAEALGATPADWSRDHARAQARLCLEPKSDTSPARSGLCGGLRSRSCGRESEE